MDRAAALTLLADGELEIVDRLSDASNATFVGRVTGTPQPGTTAQWAPCVYKPVRGERPLDDFPPGTLANRERAAFLLSEASGWDIVPPTVLRDGPLGRGMVQLWVEPDPSVDLIAMIMAPDPRLRPICIFDVVANNADRKGSHVLPQRDGSVRGVDHGICFAEQPKLRTVLWAWRGQPLEEDEMDAVDRTRTALDGELGAELEEILTPAEVRATARRAVALLEAGRLPLPDPYRRQVPWPPF